MKDLARSKIARSLALLFSSALLQASEPEVIPLWSEGAPGSEARRLEPEQAADWWVKNIHNPSVTVFRPAPGQANPTAIIIFPGGGHREVVFEPEGRAPGEFFARLGITAFAVKYRLANEAGSTYDLLTDVAADAHRAMRLVRQRAAEFGIDPHRIGVMGWSAGGELAAIVSYGDHAGNPQAADPIDRQDSRPDFLINVYPGRVGTPAKLPADAPPTLFLCATNDRGHIEPILDLLPQYVALQIPVEAHLFAQGGHAFNLGERSTLQSVHALPDRIADWLKDSGWLNSPTKN